MPARQGRLYEAAVLRPLAERVVELLMPRAGELCLDLPCDGGALSAALARAVGDRGEVLAVDGDAGARDDCAEAAAALGLRAIRVAAEPDSIERDVCASLFTLALLDDPAAGLAALAACRAPHGRLAVVVWGRSAVVPHEAALADALATIGHGSVVVERLLALGEPGALRGLASSVGLEDCRELRLRDVVRFEGVDHLWACLVDDRRAVSAATEPIDAAARAAVRAQLTTELSRYSARDGTLCIPVELAVLISSSKSR